jgi:hypothetical protein
MQVKISLREVFWLVLVAGLSLGWWLDHAEATRKRIELSKACQTWKDRADAVSEQFYIEGGGPSYRWGSERDKVYYIWPKGNSKVTGR